MFCFIKVNVRAYISASVFISKNICIHHQIKLMSILYTYLSASPALRLFFLLVLQIRNIALYLSRTKFRPLVWRNTHPYVVVDRYEDITYPQKVRYIHDSTTREKGAKNLIESAMLYSSLRNLYPVYLSLCIQPIKSNQIYCIVLYRWWKTLGVTGR